MPPPPWSFPPQLDHHPWQGRRMVYRYPVYTRRHDYYPGWLPPGAMQVYGPAPTHYYEEFRSNSANLPVPPPVDYVWSRPTRRTKSSAHTLVRRTPYSEFQPGRPRRENQPQKQTLNHQNSFASRFFNEREPKTDPASQVNASRHNPSHLIHGRVLIEPDVHDKHSLVSQVLVSRPASRTSHQTERSASDRYRPDSQVSTHSARTTRSRVSEHSARTQRSCSDHRNNEDQNYRVVSELLPHNTHQIHQAILESGRKVSNSSSKSQSSCTCYQCQNSQKSSQNSLLELGQKTPYTSLVPDINSNLIVPGK